MSYTVMPADMELHPDIEEAREKLRKAEETDVSNSPVYYREWRKVLDAFEKELQRRVIVEGPAYRIEIYDGELDVIMALWSIEETPPAPPEYWEPPEAYLEDEYVLLRYVVPYLSPEEYAKKMGVEEQTIRTWLRRGKLKSARKVGGEWQIPVTIANPRNRQDPSVYHWDTKLYDLPPEYEFLNQYDTVQFTRVRANEHIATFWRPDEDSWEERMQKQYDVKKGIKDKTEEDGDQRVLSTEDREALEFFLISHPAVIYHTKPAWLH